MNVMESDQQHTERETVLQHWRSFKLVIDPALTNGLHKVYRYDGHYFNIPVRDLGVFPVESVRDPRICRLWSKCERLELTFPKFKIDECYVGPIPPKEVTFARLNDNIREDFLSDMCKKYGQIDEVEIFYHPKNKKHLGIGKVVFDTVKAAKETVQHLHETSAMGNIIHVEIDSNGENRSRYLQLLISGLYTPWTLPVGSDEQTLQSLVDSLPGSNSMNRQGTISSPSSVATALSLDTAYSSIWLDTPGSFGLTPHSQGTPHTPCWSGTPLSQDSCYSSMQATPILQGEPSTYSVHKPFRREVCYRKPARHNGRSRNGSDVSSIFKHLPLQPPQSHLPLLKGQESRELLTSASSASPLNYNSATVLSINVRAEQQAVSSPPRILELPRTESLDSRIEMLLKKSQGFKGRCVETTDSPCKSRYSPISEVLPDCMPETRGTLPSSQQPSANGLVDVSPTPLPFEDQEETAQAVASLLRTSQSPAPSPCRPPNQRSATANQFIIHRNKTRFTKERHAPDEDKESCTTKQSGAFLSRVTSSFPQHAPFASFSGTLQQPHFNSPPESMPEKCHPRATPLPFPIPPVPCIPPAIPPFPVPLPNGRISFPPPGWTPPPGHRFIPIPPPNIPPPPALLGAPPPLIAPPSVAAHGPFWPSFNPFVPPPGYRPVVDNPHKVTVEKVLDVIVEELKSIIKKDITRRMVEGAAFKAFDEWWEGQEHKAKMVVAPLKAGSGRVEERTKPANSLSHIIGQSKPPLPSFKVKKKTLHQTTPSDVPENVLSPAHENNSHLENAGMEEGSDNTKQISEKARPGEVFDLSMKRRHARPLHLDSDDDVEEEDSKLKNEEITFDKGDNSAAVDATEPAKDAKECDLNNDDEDKEEEEIENKEPRQDEASEGGQFSDSGTLSETDTSEDYEISSDFNSSDSYSSESSEDSSYYDLSSEDDEDNEAYNKEASSDGCIVISSDDELMELEPPVTPSAPLTPAAQLGEGLQEWSEGGLRSDPGVDLYTAGPHGLRVSDLVMEFQTSEHQDLLQPPSPIGLPVIELTFDVEMVRPEWSVDSPDNIENMRPLTPTGSLVDSEPDLLISSKPTPPAVEEEECPHTPGQGVGGQLESEDSMHELLSLPPTSPESILSPFEPRASYPVYQDTPRTPGTDESGCSAHSSVRAPATPGRGTTGTEGSVLMSPPLSSPQPLPFPSNNPYSRTPQTPGRDIILSRRFTVHGKKMRMVTASHGQNTSEFLRGSPIMMSSPCSLSDSTASPHNKGVGTQSGPRAKPLQGLENVPGRLGEDHQRETENTSLRREQWRWERRRRKIKRRRERSIKRARRLGRPAWYRSQCAEMRILHGVWREGLDEEDARLLQVTYDRLLQQDSGFGWLSDTCWIAHPLTRTSMDVNVELNCWPKNHRTGSARSEGFYKISRKDKMKYLNSTRPVSQLPSPTTQQGKCIPAQPLTSLRAGSDFRSEQRRLLSTFSCDSDLVKFNQLKFRKKRISFCRSHIHDWGLFAMEPIAADEMVIEYVGQTIRQVIADMREKRYEDEGIGSSYLFRIDHDTIIDATKCGNLARFINHSCNPNCYAKIISVESQKKIVIYSRQPIGINEEITYDYKFPIEDKKIPCLCGAVTCRGSLN